MYVDEKTAQPNNAPNASTLKKKNVTSALKEVLLYNHLGNSARSITEYLTALFSGRRFNTVKATATQSALNNDAAEKLEYRGRSRTAKLPAMKEAASLA